MDNGNIYFKSYEEKPLLTDLFLPPNKINTFNTDSSIVFRSDPSVLATVATTTPSMLI